jgi:hypothetical protein
MAFVIGDPHANPSAPARHGTADLAKAEDVQPLADHLGSQPQAFMQPTFFRTKRSTTQIRLEVASISPSAKSATSSVGASGVVATGTERARARLQIDGVSADVVDRDDLQPRQRINDLVAGAMRSARHDGAHREADCAR